MLRLIKPDLASAGQSYPCDGAPSFVFHFRTRDALLPECGHLGLQIVAHEIELVPAILLGWMNCHFRGRQGEDEPSMPCVHRRKSEDIAQKIAIGLRIPAV